MKKWEDLPDCMKNNSVKKYYTILQHKKINLFLKRAFDIMFSLIGLIILSPLFLLLGIAIKIDSKGPVFFRQERVTRYNQTFRIFKFRTMIQGAETKGSLVTIKNDCRITKVGNLIRKCRLDETPQLINILIGEMTFVGTRPEVRKYVDAYTDEMRATLLMRAGVTSLASIYFKDEDELINKYIAETNLTPDQVYIKKVLPEKMKINLRCLKKFNLSTDIVILFKTAFSVI